MGKGPIDNPNANLSINVNNINKQMPVNDSTRISSPNKVFSNYFFNYPDNPDNRNNNTNSRKAKPDGSDFIK